MRLETVTSPPVLGAGRVLSYNFPAIETVTNVGAQANGRNAQTGRPYGRVNDIVSGAVGFTVTTVGAPPAGDGLQLYKNRRTYAITSSVGTGRTLQSNFATNQPWVIAFQETKASDDVSAVDDMHVWEYSAILAFDAIPGAVTGDVGMTVGVGTRADIRTSFAGIELGPSNAGVLSVIAKQVDGAGLTLNQVVTNAIDFTVFHKYALRIVSATAQSDALLKVLVDGAVLTTIPWGAGTVLPTQSQGGAGTNLGFEPSIINKSATAAGTVRMYIANRGCTVCAAPTEADLA